VERILRFAASSSSPVRIGKAVVPGAGRFLVLVSPPGFEGFFRVLAEAERTGSSMPEAYGRVSEKYGVTLL
jgi:hypothetical protein